ncbi:MAG: hypothetical protein O7C67_20300 [Gammaproteobacteria bacterium]|nr:hypothetical protein [Gammaproteobacteria bacterium]
MDLSYGVEYDSRSFIEQNRDRAPQAAAMRSQQTLDRRDLAGG